MRKWSIRETWKEQREKERDKSEVVIELKPPHPGSFFPILRSSEIRVLCARAFTCHPSPIEKPGRESGIGSSTEAQMKGPHSSLSPPYSLRTPGTWCHLDALWFKASVETMKKRFVLLLVFWELHAAVDTTATGENELGKFLYTGPAAFWSPQWQLIFIKCEW